MDLVEELAAREAIKDVKARYCRFLDTKDYEAYADLFLEDAVMDVERDTGLPPMHGRDAFIPQVIDSVQHAKTTHHVHTPEITFESPDRANIIWAMQDRLVWQEGKCPIPGVQSLTGYGHYHETYERRDGRWRIASLKLTRLNLEMQP